MTQPAKSYLPSLISQVTHVTYITQVSSLRSSHTLPAQLSWSLPWKRHILGLRASARLYPNNELFKLWVGSLQLSKQRRMGKSNHSSCVFPEQGLCILLNNTTCVTTATLVVSCIVVGCWKKSLLLLCYDALCRLNRLWQRMIRFRMSRGVVTGTNKSDETVAVPGTVERSLGTLHVCSLFSIEM